MIRELKNQWQFYKDLELIPDSVLEPQASKLAIALPLRQLWRLLIDALARELVYEQQIEYLERCWTVGDSEPFTDVSSNTWQKLWTLMN